MLDQVGADVRRHDQHRRSGSRCCRPKESVRRPSSMICSSMLKMSGCAFSISSSRTTAVGATADLLGQLATFFVADVAGRRTDQARGVVLLHVLRHVDLTMIASSVPNMNFASALRQTRVFPTPVGPTKRKEPIGRIRVFQARARATNRAWRSALMASSWLTTISVPSSSLHLEQTLRLRPDRCGCSGMPVILATVSADHFAH